MPRKLNVAVTGEDHFARRHRFLFDAMKQHHLDVQFATTRCRTLGQRLELVAREVAFIAMRLKTRRWRLPRTKNDVRMFRRAFIFSVTSFITKSRQVEQSIRRLVVVPDVVFHIFSLYGPVWSSLPMPYVHYLDNTTALGQRNWSNNPPPEPGEYQQWLALERSTYRRAARLFVMSERVRRSLIDDYDVEESAITVVGSGGQFRDIYSGAKAFGSKRILFNGAPFELKGGDIVLAAFEKVRLTYPEATLIVIGTSLAKSIAGVVNPGFIGDADTLRRLFLDCDLVVAPSRADAFPGFVIEAMSHAVPCIVSAVGGMPEIVDDGVNGVVLTAIDSSNLANSIIDLLGDRSLLQSFSKAAHAKALARFSWDAIGEKIAVELRVLN